MNEHELLSRHIRETLITGEDFLTEQAPLLVQEILTFGFWAALFRAIVGIVVLILACSLVNYGRQQKRDNFDKTLFCYLAGGCLGLLGITATIVNIEILLQIQFAPRLFVIEQLMRST